MMQSDLRLLKLLQLSSPALPIGAYAYSQGLEFAIENQWVVDADSLAEWLQGVLRQNMVSLDLPILQRSYLGWRSSSLDEVEYWNQVLNATRESYELQLEDRQLAMALKRVLWSWGLEMDLVRNAIVSAVDSDGQKIRWNYVSMFALAGVLLDIDYNALAQGFVWSWLENQVAVATKAVPIGQSDGLRVVEALLPVIPDFIARSGTVQDDDIGALAPMFALGSCLHETQYSRLFRS